MSFEKVNSTYFFDIDFYIHRYTQFVYVNNKFDVLLAIQNNWPHRQQQISIYMNTHNLIQISIYIDIHNLYGQQYIKFVFQYSTTSHLFLNYQEYRPFFLFCFGAVNNLSHMHYGVSLSRSLVLRRGYEFVTHMESACLWSGFDW